MSAIKITPVAVTAFFLMALAAVGQGKSDQDFQQALEQVRQMLDGNAPLSFQRAVFVTENAYWDNRFTYEQYQNSLDREQLMVEKLMEANDKSASMDFRVIIDRSKPRYDASMFRYTEEEKRELYRQTLANWAIFSYITDTTYFGGFEHLPFTYRMDDPFGMSDWKHSQVIDLIGSSQRSGNCFALTSMFKIMADRLNSKAHICTAPQHIYIQHQDHKGHFYNVELATATHPGDGSIQTLTYTWNEAIMSGIALRRLDEKQSVVLCLVNLGKSYEHKFGTKDDPFILQCAELALKHDPLSLNALLLKRQVLEERVVKYAVEHGILAVDGLRTDQSIGATFAGLEALDVHLLKLGYHQMPAYMQEMIFAAYKREDHDTKILVEDRTPNPFTSIEVDPEDRRYSTLSGGVFEEVHRQKPYEQYGHFVLDVATKKLVKLDMDGVTGQLIDPVVFAMSVDPMSSNAADWSPYNAFWNSPVLNVDPNGAWAGEYYKTDGTHLGSDNIDDGKIYEVEGETDGLSIEQLKSIYDNPLDESLGMTQRTSVTYLGQESEVFKTWDNVTNERILDMHPAVRMKAALFVNQVESKTGTQLRIAQGTRTFSEQNSLYAQGRTTIGSRVTNAKGGQSYHNYGLAFDIVGIEDGRAEYNLNYNTISSIGKGLGLEWGGDFKSFRDRPHFQLTYGHSTKSLLQLYNSNKLSNNGHVELE